MTLTPPAALLGNLPPGGAAGSAGSKGRQQGRGPTGCMLATSIPSLLRSCICAHCGIPWGAPCRVPVTAGVAPLTSGVRFERGSAAAGLYESRILNRHAQIPCPLQFSITTSISPTAPCARNTEQPHLNLPFGAALGLAGALSELRGPSVPHDQCHQRHLQNCSNRSRSGDERCTSSCPAPRCPPRCGKLPDGPCELPIAVYHIVKFTAWGAREEGARALSSPLAAPSRRLRRPWRRRLQPPQLRLPPMKQPKKRQSLQCTPKRQCF